MPIVTYRVEVYRRNIAKMFLPSGDAGKWIYKVSSEMIAAARAGAPRRSGALKAAHRIERRRMTDAFFGNQYEAAYEIRNDAEHASWVHEGTAKKGTGFIYSTTPGKAMIVPRRGYRGPLRGADLPRNLTAPHKAVSGQKPQPWLNDACVAVSMRYGAVPYRI